jgi:hypothetical protein
VLSCHDSSAPPQAAQTASPVCGTKNFSSVRLYSAPQLALNNCRHPWNMRPEPSIFQPENAATIKLSHTATGGCFATPRPFQQRRQNL